jgi:glycosyltransferase involved in cell wall biosynthesis
MQSRPDSPELSILIPVYNEGENIARVLTGINREVGEESKEVLVVYDSDEDNTLPVVRGLMSDMPWLRLHQNDRGPGVLNALKSGLRAARGSFVLVMMADGSDEPSVVDSMMTQARDGADLVAGSRYMRGGRQVGGPMLKRTLSLAAGLSLHWLAGLPIHDATSNFRLYSRRLLEGVTIESTAGFELGLELTVKAYVLGLKLAEVPTTWSDRTAGRSRFRLWKWLPHYLRWYWDCMRAAWSKRIRRPGQALSLRSR